MKTLKKHTKNQILKRLSLGLLALGYAGTLAFQPSLAANNVVNKTDYEPGFSEQVCTQDELIVEVKPSLKYFDVDQLLKSAGATHVEPLTYQAWLVKFASLSDLYKAQTTLKTNANIISIGRNFKLHQCGSNTTYLNQTVGSVNSASLKPLNLPNDPYFGSEWHMGAVKVANDQPGENIASFNGVVILDNGVGNKFTNPDLQMMMDNYDLHMASWQSSWDSTADHGTELATTLGAKWNDSKTAGVVRTPRIWSVRLTKEGKGQMTEADLLQGLLWARGNVGNTSGYPISVVVPLNIAPPYSLSNIKYHPAFHEICKNIHDNFSGLIFLAAGNDGLYDSSAAVSYINVVGACDKDGKLLASSNRGKCLTLIAPGKDIVCTDHSGNLVSANGTSFSAAIAAGVVNLIHNRGRELGRFLKNFDLDYYLKCTCSMKPQTGWSDTAGFGMPDYKAAIKAIKSNN